MELLAPAGGTEQLQAAVRFGADAVYLAADRFGMRARAANFALDAVGEAVRYAHDHGVKVYVACNVLMTPDDIDAFPPYLHALDEAGVDALIVGDMGAFALAREFVPDISLHVSTQASVANAAAARAWYRLGARRVVCAREMSLNDIARMREDVPDDLELEAFVHGAMCMAVSGRCLISAYLTGRSGNEGDCAQPCRWKYALEEETRPGVYFPIDEDERGSFILNAKDLNMIAHLDELAAAGVNAIKIEGRNKKAFYVATVVGAYRRVLDGGDIDDAEVELLAVSHRPYGTGFYFGEAQQASDFEGYEQQTLHVADVLDCREMGDWETDALVSGDRKADARVSDERVSDDLVSDERALDARKTDDQEQRWILTVQCRNRFEDGSELEILRPHAVPIRVAVRDLVWLKQNDAADGERIPEPVKVANRASEQYSFVVQGLDAPIEAGSFLRVREYRRSTGGK